MAGPVWTTLGFSRMAKAAPLTQQPEFVIDQEYRLHTPLCMAYACAG